MYIFFKNYPFDETNECQTLRSRNSPGNRVRMEKKARLLCEICELFFFSHRQIIYFFFIKKTLLLKKKRKLAWNESEKRGRIRRKLFRFGCFSSQLFFFPLFTLFSIQTEYGFLCGGLITVTSCLSHLLGWDKEDSIQGWTGIIRGDKKVVAFRRAIEIKRNTTLYDSWSLVARLSIFSMHSDRSIATIREKERTDSNEPRNTLPPVPLWLFSRKRKN